VKTGTATGLEIVRKKNVARATVKGTETEVKVKPQETSRATIVTKDVMSSGVMTKRVTSSVAAEIEVTMRIASAMTDQEIEVNERNNLARKRIETFPRNPPGASKKLTTSEIRGTGSLLSKSAAAGQWMLQKGRATTINPSTRKRLR
jgi:hypothetical protein